MEEYLLKMRKQKIRRKYLNQQSERNRIALIIPLYNKLNKYRKILSFYQKDIDNMREERKKNPFKFEVH